MNQLSSKVEVEVDIGNVRMQRGREKISIIGVIPPVSTEIDYFIWKAMGETMHWFERHISDMYKDTEITMNELGNKTTERKKMPNLVENGVEQSATEQTATENVGTITARMPLLRAHEFGTGTWKEGFKVVRYEYRTYLSAVIPRGIGHAIVSYTVGKITKPEKGCGALCVFEKNEDALAFKQHLVEKFGHNRNYMVKMCLYKPSSQTTVKRVRYSFRERGEEVHQLSELTKGTALASKVILLYP